MKMVICGSIDVTPAIQAVQLTLTNLGHNVRIPAFSERIIQGEISLADFIAVKERDGDTPLRIASGEDAIKRHYDLITASEAILVVNVEKKGVANYIGGNTFLEMGFAYVLGKKIFLLNPIPEVSYRDELLAMHPIILNGDLSNLK
jgi:hypothetical protein